MSLESAKKFFERILKDEKFKAKVAAFKDDRKAKWEFLKKEGFEFTKEEIDKVKAEYLNELSDEQLKSIVGGSYSCKKKIK